MWWRRKSRQALVCRQAVELVTAYLEGALPARDRARLEAHLDACPHGSGYLKRMRETLGLMGRIEPDALEPEVRSELVTLYRQWQRE